MPLYIMGPMLLFGVFLHPKEWCGKRLTQVRIAKLCLKSAIGDSIKRAVAPWTPSRLGHA